MKTINEIEKRRGEAEKHGDFVQPGVMEAFYEGMVAAFVEVISILEEEGAKSVTKRINIMIEEEKKNLEDKIKRAQDAAQIKEIRTACRDMIFGDPDIAEMGLALLAGIIDVFPVKLFEEIPELVVVRQKLENREVKIR